MAIRAAFPKHGPLLEDPSGRIDDLLKFINRREVEILRTAKLQKNGNKRPFETAKELFKGLDRGLLLLAISEVIGHLEILEESNLTVRENISNFRYTIA